MTEVFSILSAILLLGNVEFDSVVNPDTGIDIVSVQRPKGDDGSNHLQIQQHAEEPAFNLYFSLMISSFCQSGSALANRCG